ncbi:MAG TPA: ATP-binding protein [Pseudonocardiaceae bacterium]|jgi:signal transduction histidine kinase|nr:ATP-binding protein [Pseudonocardiaceae bacterium]
MADVTDLSTTSEELPPAAVEPADQSGEPAATPAEPRSGPWPLRRLIAVGVLTITAFSILAVLFGGLALANLAHARDQAVNQVDPAVQQALRLDASLLDQETGVRGYALSGQPDFLAPYTSGLATQRDAVGRLEPLLTNLPTAAADLRTVNAAVNAWRSSYAEPTIQKVRSIGRPLVASDANLGKSYFDTVRAGVTTLERDLGQAHQQAVTTLDHSATVLDSVCIGIAVVLVVIVALLGFGLRAAALRPLDRLAGEVRQIAAGAFEHPVEQSGPREVRALGADVNRMRERILHELSAVRSGHAVLDARTNELQRSNAELEQFAYVASHDLQEPLRKVASFCQLLQRRYGGQLDERADQYIGFAVDGAKRMQVLINDLLAFSRVGRMVAEQVPVPASALVEQAKANLAAAVNQTHARIEVGELPVVMAEVPLLTAVFQNLLGNALKFHGEASPEITVAARRDGENWLFSVADNGIGIDADYAERIFVIFQRLHGKGEYPGTGIGLAMCRKIVEHHGGRIWLDTTVTSGSRFCFTLPALPEEEEADD